MIRDTFVKRTKPGFSSCMTISLRLKSHIAMCVDFWHVLIEYCHCTRWIFSERCSQTKWTICYKSATAKMYVFCSLWLNRLVSLLPWWRPGSYHLYMVALADRIYPLKYLRFATGILIVRQILSLCRAYGIDFML
jgi:hypothetical protein